MDLQIMTLKRHKVAQLRRVELTSSVMLVFVGRDEGGTTVIRHRCRPFSKRGQVPAKAGMNLLWARVWLSIIT